jgi:aspartyl-tRNA(Asn)/glutamyl-tRNA(Gln) amidotransferase subunit B
MVAAVIAANEKIAGEIRGGKVAALKSLVGLVMRESKGRANPQMVNESLRRSFGLPPE